jgi:hypothetical protein
MPNIANRIGWVRAWFCLLFALAGGVASFAGTNQDILAASKSGDRAGVQAALASGASANAVDEKGLAPGGIAGLTPLALAAAYGHKNVALLLLSEGAKVDAVDIKRDTPLHQAAANPENSPGLRILRRL